MIVRIFLLLAAGITLTACVSIPPVPVLMYEGQPQALESVAVVAVGYNVAGIAITQVDGKPIPNAGNSKGVHLLPGVHIFHAFTSRATTNVTSVMTSGNFVAKVEAGHSYVGAQGIDEKTGRSYFYLLDKGVGYDQNCLVESYPDKFDLRKNAKSC